MPGSFEELYADRFRDVANLVRPLVGADAEDVANDAFSVAWARWNDLRGFDLPDAWVRKVARRIALTRLRRDIVRAQREPLTASPDPDGMGDPDLNLALRRLPDEIRTAVWLHYVADRPLDDVASELRTIAPTVKTWLHRARPQLAEEVSGLRGRWVLE